jgi:hypothetical protein
MDAGLNSNCNGFEFLASRYGDLHIGHERMSVCLLLLRPSSYSLPIHLTAMATSFRYSPSSKHRIVVSTATASPLKIPIQECLGFT